MFERLKFWKKCSSTVVGSYVTQADLKALEERLVKKMTQLQNDVNQETALVQQIKAAVAPLPGLFTAQSQTIAGLKQQLADAGVDPAVIAQLEANNTALQDAIGTLSSLSLSGTTGDASNGTVSGGATVGGGGN